LHVILCTVFIVFLFYYSSVSVMFSHVIVPLMHHIYDHQQDKAMAVGEYKHTSPHTNTDTKRKTFITSCQEKKSPVSTDPIFFTDIHAEATFINTPVQLLVKINISSANHTY